MKKLPIGTQTYEIVAAENCLYADKTDLIYKMTQSYRYVFMSRPRRFGKSLLVSTIRSYFEGRKDLFAGTAIMDLEKDWEQHAVVHLDLSIRNNNVDELRQSVHSMLSDVERELRLPSSEGLPLDARLKSIVVNANNQTGKPVVLLIDEYDAMMLNSMDNRDLFVEIRSMLNNLFSPIKYLDKLLKFVFITGISKFSQVSIFSVLNNLIDVSLDPVYEGICGFTKEDMRGDDFKEYVQAIADKYGWDLETTYEKLRKYYDGYHFSDEMTCDVFNPFSVLKCLALKRMDPYWFDSASPSALFAVLDKFDLDFQSMNEICVGTSGFSVPIERFDDIIPLLFQSGYLSIKGYKARRDEYILSFPNREVRIAFAEQLINYKAQTREPRNTLRHYFLDFEEDDNLDKFVRHLKVFFAGFPYSLNNKNEMHYHSILYTVLVSFGADVVANPETALGKADLLLRMPESIYVIELKYNRNTDVALDQIDDRDYTTAHIDDGRKVYKVALNFDDATRNISGYDKQEVKL